MAIAVLKAQFDYLLFERVNPAQNVYRFSSLAWQPSLVEDGVVVRIAGRKLNGRQQVLALLSYSSLEAAWPLIRRIIHTWLRHGYRMVERNG
jgi:hypothetical protein